MALSRISNPQDTVTAITAALWTSEFDNIYNNALSLISPLTGNLDLNGFKLPNLAAGTAGSPALPFTGDADTGLFRVGADEAGIAAAGAASATFTNPASAVNYVKWSGSATGNAVTGTATGTDANISMNFVPKGTGTIQANSIEIVTISSTQTLTNKTLTTPTIASFVNATHTHTAGAGGGQIAAGGYAAGSIVNADISATAAIGVSKLSKTTGAFTGGNNAIFLVQQFAFGSPNASADPTFTVAARIGASDLGTKRAWIAEMTGGAGTYTWDYLTGSGDPQLWALRDAAGVIRGMWEAEDPADSEWPDEPPVSRFDVGLTQVRINVIPEVFVTQVLAWLEAAPFPSEFATSRLYKDLRGPALLRALVQSQFDEHGLEVPPDIREVYGAIADPQKRLWRLQKFLRAASRCLHNHRSRTLIPLLQARCRVSPTGVLGLA